MAMTPKQKKFAALAPPRNKITYADKIAGATKGKAKRGKTKMTKAIKRVDPLVLWELPQPLPDLKEKDKIYFI